MNYEMKQTRCRLIIWVCYLFSLESMNTTAATARDPRKFHWDHWESNRWLSRLAADAKEVGVQREKQWYRWESNWRQGQSKEHTHQ